MSTLKRSLVSLLSVAVLATSLPVHARAGASSGGARSAPSAARAAPAPARAAPAPAAAPQRVATGGMQRSDAMAQARAQSPANAQRVAPQAAPAPTQAPAPANYATTQQPQQQRQGYSGGQMAGAAAAAGVGGFLLGRVTAPTPAAPAPGVAPHGGYAPGAAGGQPGTAMNGDFGPGSHAYSGAAAPMGVAPSGSSGMGFLGMLIILMLLGGFAYFMYRRFSEQKAGSFSSFGTNTARSSNAYSQGTSTTPVAETELLNRAPKLFRDVQNANNAGDKAALERLVDESFLPQLVADIDNRSEPSRTSVMKLDVVGDRVLGFTREGYRYVGSVHFDALISEGGAPAETVEEVWHFVRNVDGGEWKLAGIEQV